MKYCNIFDDCLFLGGICDIFVMEVVNDGNIEYIWKVMGGVWGGGKVNEEFSVFFNKIFGEDVVI